MQTYHVGIIALVLAAFLGLLAVASWKKRVTNQELSFPKPMSAEEVSDGIHCFYVATTFLNKPLDRVLAHGLAHRGFADVGWSNRGLEINRRGETSFLIHRESLMDISRRTAVIDKAVEKDGLVSVAWRNGEIELETHFRIIDVNQQERFMTSSAAFLRSEIG
jgi:hypothetical protein